MLRESELLKVANSQYQAAQRILKQLDTQVIDLTDPSTTSLEQTQNNTLSQVKTLTDTLSHLEDLVLPIYEDENQKDKEELTLGLMALLNEKLGEYYFDYVKQMEALLSLEEKKGYLFKADHFCNEALVCGEVSSKKETSLSVHLLHLAILTTFASLYPSEKEHYAAKIKTHIYNERLKERIDAIPDKIKRERFLAALQSYTSFCQSVVENPTSQTHKRKREPEKVADASSPVKKTKPTLSHIDAMMNRGTILYLDAEADLDEAKHQYQNACHEIHLERELHPEDFSLHERQMNCLHFLLKCQLKKDKRSPDLEDIGPLFQAVHNGLSTLSRLAETRKIKQRIDDKLLELEKIFNAKKRAFEIAESQYFYALYIQHHITDHQEEDFQGKAILGLYPNTVISKIKKIEEAIKTLYRSLTYFSSTSNNQNDLTSIHTLMSALHEQAADYTIDYLQSHPDLTVNRRKQYLLHADDHYSQALYFASIHLNKNSYPRLALHFSCLETSEQLARICPDDADRYAQSMKNEIESMKLVERVAAISNKKKRAEKSKILNAHLLFCQQVLEKAPPRKLDTATDKDLGCYASLFQPPSPPPPKPVATPKKLEPPRRLG